MWTYLLFRLGIPLVARVPERLLVLVGWLIGAATYVANGSAREAVYRNLAVVVPDANRSTRRRLTMRTFMHGVWGYIELLRLGSASPDLVRARYEIEGWEHIDEAVAQKRGILMVTCHAGTPAAAGQLIALRGVPSTLVVEQLQPRPLHDLVARVRGAFGVRIVTIGRDSARDMIAALRRKELVGIVSDRDVAGSGRDLPFFGKVTRVTTAAATLALRTNAVVLPAFASRTGLFAGRGRIEAPVEMPRTGDTAADVRDGTLRILARIEMFIRENPDQWAVFSDVWPAAGPTDGDRVGLSTMPEP
jgi:lauroyl/myristoyl acyltransferase